MPRYNTACSVLVGAALAVAGCRQDAGLAPEDERRAAGGTGAQCLAPDHRLTPADPAFVRSRLAAVLVERGEVVCLSQEAGRWGLHRMRDAEILAE
jgi:hypothetical protein